MAVLGRLLVSSAERLDLPDLLSIDSYGAGDWKFFIKSLVGDDKPFILQGFDLIDPDQSIGSTSVSIQVADSVVYYPGSSAGPFFHGLEEGNTLAQPLIPELKKNSTNYIYVTFSTSDQSRDTRSFWDPDKEGGDGGEFTQDVNTESALIVEVNVSNASFPINTIPIAKVVVGANFIESIEDSRDMMFRLGSGGLNTNPAYNYEWRELPSADYSRQEPPTIMTNSLDPNPFQGGDKNILSLKEWMDAVMTKLKELGGTTFWYKDTSTYNLINLFLDALGSNIRSKGTWEHSSATPGEVEWSEDIVYQSIHDPREYIIRAGSETLNNDEVLYTVFDRNLSFNDFSLAVDWVNGQPYINGQVSSFQHLKQGDWIKKYSDDDNYYVRVEGFWSATNGGGVPTTASLAQSVTVNVSYAGATGTAQGVRCKGIYSNSDVYKGTRSDTAMFSAGGNLFWMAIRNDSIQSITSLQSYNITLDITEGDGVTAKCTSVGHGLSDGERITISGSTNYDGTYIVEKETDDIFYIQTTQTTDESSVDAYYALITTTARNSSGGIQLESANHNFETDQKVTISGTASYNGSFDLFVRSDTTFTVPFASAPPLETSGTATVAKINVRTEIGQARIVQGEVKYIGEVDTDNIKQFVGMNYLGQTNPIYLVPTLPASLNTMLHGQANYNSEDGESLVSRAARLTAMMADKAQDKTIGYLHDWKICTNVTNGANQEIEWTNTDETGATQDPHLYVGMPSSANNGTITLNNGPLVLAVNQVAYYQLDRNDTFSADLSGLTVVDIDECPLHENVFIVAYRLGDTTVWLWDGTELSVGYNHSSTAVSDVLNENAYDEILSVVSGAPGSSNEITGPVSSGTVIMIPDDSRDSGSTQYYVVGNGVLEIRLNGQYLQHGVDWQEVGAAGTVSSTFQILQDLVVGDELNIRIDTAGGYITSGSGGGGISGGANIGGGAGEVFSSILGSTMQFRTIEAGANMTVTTVGNTVQLAATLPSNNLSVVTQTVDYSVQATDDVVMMDCGATDKTVTLPDATLYNGRVLHIKRISSGAGNCLIRGNGTQTIDSEAHPSYTDDKTRLINQWDAITVVSNGTAWFVI